MIGKSKFRVILFMLMSVNIALHSSDGDSNINFPIDKSDKNLIEGLFTDGPIRERLKQDVATLYGKKTVKEIEELKISCITANNIYCVS